MPHIDRVINGIFDMEDLSHLYNDNDCHSLPNNGCHRSAFAKRFRILKYMTHSLNPIPDCFR
jgi:hypothetical protein